MRWPRRRGGIPAQVDGKPLGEVGDGCLAGRIGWNAREWAHGIHRRDIEDDALASGGHIAAEYQAGDNCAHAVEVEDLLEHINGQIEEPAFGVGCSGGAIAPSPADENIHASPCRHDGTDAACSTAACSRTSQTRARAACHPRPL